MKDYPFFYNCGIISHCEVECDKEDPREGKLEVVQQYGDWMRASSMGKKIVPAKSLGRRQTSP